MVLKYRIKAAEGTAKFITDNLRVALKIVYYLNSQFFSYFSLKNLRTN